MNLVPRKDAERRAMTSVAFTSSLRRNFWLAAGILVAAGLFALSMAWSARVQILRGAARTWIVSDSIAPADAVAVLGGGLATRPFAAAELYKMGMARQILISDAQPSPAETLGIVASHVEQNRAALLKLGIPAEAITVFGAGVTNTYEEARALSEWVSVNGSKRVIVPTEFFSSRRVRWILNKELGRAGVEIEVQALPPLHYGIDNWWQHEDGVIAFQNEVIKYLYYRVNY